MSGKKQPKRYYVPVSKEIKRKLDLAKVDLMHERNEFVSLSEIIQSMFDKLKKYESK